jgi:hypothetical protein
MPRVKKEFERGATDRRLANLKLQALSNIAELIENHGINILEPLGVTPEQVKEAYPDYFCK